MHVVGWLLLLVGYSISSTSGSLPSRTVIIKPQPLIYHWPFVADVLDASSRSTCTDKYLRLFYWTTSSTC